MTSLPTCVRKPQLKEPAHELSSESFADSRPQFRCAGYLGNGDDTHFDRAGVATINFNSPSPYRQIHSPKDILETVDPARVADIAQFGAALIRTIVTKR